jgi:hypothetical protein
VEVFLRNTKNHHRFQSIFESLITNFVNLTTVPGSSVGIMIDCGLDGREIRFRFPAGPPNPAQWASEASFLGVKTQTHLHLEPRLRIYGATPPPPILLQFKILNYLSTARTLPLLLPTDIGNPFTG